MKNIATILAVFAVMVMAAAPAWADDYPMDPTPQSEYPNQTPYWDPSYPHPDDDENGQYSYPGELQSNGDIWVNNGSSIDVWTDDEGPGWPNTRGLDDGPPWPEYGSRFLKENSDGSQTEYMQTEPDWDIHGVDPQVVGDYNQMV